MRHFTGDLGGGRLSHLPFAVCIPARNERDHLGRLLGSLQQQTSGWDRGQVFLVANNCTDDTAAIARSWSDKLPVMIVDVVLSAPDAHVGTARRIALEAGADWLASQSPDEGVLLTTDADAHVPPTWVSANFAALRDAEVVGGHLVVAPDGPLDLARDALDAEIERYWQFVREMEDRIDPPPHDPTPRHGDHTGASLAFRASLYRRVGGLPPLPCGEDNAFVRIVREAGGRLRHSPDVQVSVSDRRVGRADGGMAAEMTRRSNVAGDAGRYELPAPEHWATLLTRRAMLRRAWCEGAFDDICGLSRDDLAAIDLQTCPNDIAFVERAACRLEARDPSPVLLTLDAALAGFEARFERAA